MRVYLDKGAPFGITLKSGFYATPTVLRNERNIKLAELMSDTQASIQLLINRYGSVEGKTGEKLTAEIEDKLDQLVKDIAKLRSKKNDTKSN